MNMSKKVIKILVDEMDDGMDEKLRSIGYDAFSVKKLRAEWIKTSHRFFCNQLCYGKQNDSGNT